MNNGTFYTPKKTMIFGYSDLCQIAERAAQQKYSKEKGVRTVVTKCTVATFVGEEDE